MKSTLSSVQEPHARIQPTWKAEVVALSVDNFDKMFGGSRREEPLLQTQLSLPHEGEDDQPDDQRVEVEPSHVFS